MAPLARVPEVALPETYRKSNIAATHAATQQYLQRRRDEQQRLAADPLARFGRVPVEDEQHKQRESAHATDRAVFERFVKQARRD